MGNILVLNGPNLNLLGTREPEVYGHTTLDDVYQRLQTKLKGSPHQLAAFQSNHEGQLVETIQQARGKIDYIIFNPGAFTHTSIALRDALLAVQIPFIEVHLSNVFQRETFRHHSYFSDIAKGVILGLGVLGYELSLAAAIEYCDKHCN